MLVQNVKLHVKVRYVYGDSNKVGTIRSYDPRPSTPTNEKKNYLLVKWEDGEATWHDRSDLVLV